RTLFLAEHARGEQSCQISDLRPQTSDLRPQTSDLRPQTSDLRPQTSDLRPQTSHHQVGPDTQGHQHQVPNQRGPQPKIKAKGTETTAAFHIHPLKIEVAKYRRESDKH